MAAGPAALPLREAVRDRDHRRRYLAPGPMAVALFAHLPGHAQELGVDPVATAPLAGVAVAASASRVPAIAGCLARGLAAHLAVLRVGRT